jgi:hypothetical protein
MGKYFKYAIGEIILVVIGILIAVQINALYNARAKTSENRLILKRMLKEVENNISRLNYLDSTGQQNSRAYHLPSFRDSEINLDSSYSIISRGITPNDIDYLVAHSDYNFSRLSTFRSVYDEMLNTGKIYTLKSDSLSTEIDNYYKLLERQNNYVVMQMGEAQRSFEQCALGWVYFKEAYKVDKENAISTNPWLFDKNAKEYKNLSNFIFKAKTVIIRTRDRIYLTIKESQNLTKTIRTYLDD